VALLDGYRKAGSNVLFEGAQGALLDIDHGHLSVRDFVEHNRRRRLHRRGVGPRSIDYVLGIVKAYTTRVGAGPFPTELFDEMGEHLARVGHEFGSVTGRARRCGWFDAVSLRRSISLNSVSGLCITKLDVLDAIDTIRICVGYRVGGRVVETPPLAADQYADCEPIYEDVPGWKSSTVGITRYEDLPENARAYLDRLQEVVGVPIDIISTGPDRAETIVLSNPFD
jgi:adenylosuccinate synthase